MRFFLLLTFLFSLSTAYPNAPQLSYYEARRHMFGDLFLERSTVTDVYCEQRFTKKHGVGVNRVPDPHYVNCEHTWPQSKFGKKDVHQKKVDLHHLFPARASANSSRSNLPLGEVRGIDRVCGDSWVGILPNGKKGFEPPNNHKGNVARAMLYFSKKYNMPIDAQQEYFFRKWNKQDPVDYQEYTRNRKIYEIQGDLNPFIVNPELVDEIADF